MTVSAGSAGVSWVGVSACVGEARGSLGSQQAAGLFHSGLMMKVNDEENKEFHMHVDFSLN